MATDELSGLERRLTRHADALDGIEGMRRSPEIVLIREAAQAIGEMRREIETLRREVQRIREGQG